jgi:hypothetical protein
MLKESIRFERKEAVMLTVDFSGKIEDYALAWLKLTNNAREYSDMIWKISNDKGNHVYVICNPKAAEAVKEFCTGIVACYDKEEDKVNYIGKVIDEVKISAGVPVYEYDSTYSCDDERWEDDMDNVVDYWLDVEE